MKIAPSLLALSVALMIQTLQAQTAAPKLIAKAKGIGL